MRNFLLFSFLISLTNANAQDCFPEKKRENKLVKKIEKQIERKTFNSASDALRNSSDHAIFFALKSEVLWLKSDFFNAESKALKAISICADKFPKVYYFLGEIAYRRRDYVNADVYLKKSIDLGITAPYFADAVNLYSKAKIIAEIINSPVSFSPKIVEGISTQFDEYLPIISPDQETAFFTRRSDKASLHSIAVTTVEEFVMSQRIDKKFTVGSPIAYPFNLESNEGGASITIDNKTLYYTKCVRSEQGYNNCDIYYVFNNSGVWSEVQLFSDSISQPTTWESQPTVSSDGKTIIFASDRAGGYGKIDLYEINLVAGRWTNPKNLGVNINSKEYEKSPYLHTDGKTLFFASTNFPNLGGFDIFYSRKDSLENWQKPVNIGYPINTAANEISLFVSTDGNRAYFASNQLSGVGGWDIYSFALHADARPARVLFLKGKLMDENGQVMEDVKLEIKNINTNEVTIVKVEKGTYVSSLTLAKNDDVLITIKKEGFSFHSTYVSSEDPVFSSPSTLNFELEYLEKGSSFVIKDIYFDHNSYKISPVAREIIIEFSNYLKLNKNLVIEINGFTDNIGMVNDNILLSENRAKAVHDLIAARGISTSRISYNGYGERFPETDNTTVKGRAKNRRIAFRILRQ